MYVERINSQLYEKTWDNRKYQPSTKPKFNRTNKNIEWASWTWNPIVGCKHGCEYCYARDIAVRFYGHFKPTFFPERLEAPKNMPKPKPDALIGVRNVFCVSMGDMFGEWVKQEWIDAILEAIGKSPEWNFIILTKNPGRLTTIDFPKNCWIGATVDTQERVERTTKAFKQLSATVKFISCEPLLEDLKMDLLLNNVDWLIIGGQSKTSRVPEFQPEWEWVESLLNQARQAKIPVYFKPNMKARPREYPIN